MQLYGHPKDLADHLPIPNAYPLIRDWIRRGLVRQYLDPDGHPVVAEGRPIYAMADVYAAELSTRRNGKRARYLTKWAAISHTVP